MGSVAAFIDGKTTIRDVTGAAIDVRIAVDPQLLAGVDHLDASVFVGDPASSTLVVATPGGGMSRRYFDLYLAGYSMAAHLAGRGITTVSVDLPGVGTTPPPTDLRSLHPDALAAALRPNDPALLLIQRIRDEAHRFAVTFHRKARTMRDLGSQLDLVPGVGPRRRRLLLTTFGSLAGVRRATREELAAVVGPKLADAVLAFFAGQP